MRLNHIEFIVLTIILYCMTKVYCFTQSLRVYSLKPSISLTFDSFSTLQRVDSTYLLFRKDSNADSSNKKSSVFEAIKKFVSTLTRARIEKQYDIPQPESGNRYHLRLVKSIFEGIYYLSHCDFAYSYIFMCRRSRFEETYYHKNITFHSRYIL